MNRRLYRSPDDRVLAGVAGGMAETYDMDPAIVRIVWALLIIFTGGLFLVLYIVMALVVPLRGDDEPLTYADDGTASTDGTTEVGPKPAITAHEGGRPRRRERRESDNSAPLILGAILIIVGGLFLLRQFVAIDIGRLWPVVVIGLGLLLIVSAFGRRQRRE